MDKPLSLAENMTLKEYQLKVEAYALQQEDRIKDIKQQAWSNLVVKNVKGSGNNVKPAYQTFIEFYDSKSARDKIRSDFEPDFKPVESPHVRKQKTVGEIRVQRMIEYEKKMKENQKDR